MKIKRALLGGLAAVSILTSGLMVSASGDQGTCECLHQHDTKVYDKILRAQIKTGEHEVYLGGGRTAICNIYTECYEIVWRCTICDARLYGTEEHPDRHSICSN